MPFHFSCICISFVCPGHNPNLSHPRRGQSHPDGTDEYNGVLSEPAPPPDRKSSPPPETSRDSTVLSICSSRSHLHRDTLPVRIFFATRPRPLPSSSTCIYPHRRDVSSRVSTVSLSSGRLISVYLVSSTNDAYTTETRTPSSWATRSSLILAARTAYNLSSRVFSRCHVRLFLSFALARSPRAPSDAVEGERHASARREPTPTINIYNILSHEIYGYRYHNDRKGRRDIFSNGLDKQELSYKICDAQQSTLRHCPSGKSAVDAGPKVLRYSIFIERKSHSQS